MGNPFTLASAEVSEPAVPKGITFLVGGAQTPLAEYNNIRDVLLERQQVVIALFTSVLTVWDYQAKMVEAIPTILVEYREKHPDLPRDYSLVGHSAGGKVVLLLASYTKDDSHPPIGQVLALDPVDMNPTDFANGKRNLESTAAQRITITWAEGTSSWSIPRRYNASTIHDATAAAPALDALVVHERAGHFAYCDNNGGILGWLMVGGDREHNEKAREDAHRLIRELF